MRSKSTGRLLGTAAGAAAAALVAGCATGTGGGQSTSTATFDPEAELSGELQVMGFGTGDEVASVRFDHASAQLQGVDINLVEGELDIQQFLSSFASGNPPGLIYADREQLGTFASRGAIMPLNQCIDAEGINLDDFRQPAIQQVTFEDQVYGVPEFNQVQILMANTQLLGQAGLGLEDVDGSDWTRISEASAQLHSSNGGQPAVIGFDSKLPEFLPLWVHANGGSLLSEDGRTAQLDSPEVVEALEFAAGVYADQGGYSAVKAFKDSADFFGSGNQFASGTLGAMPMEQWYVNILSDVSPDAPVDFTTLKTQEGEPMSYATGSAWAIPANSANPQAACRFLKHMTSQDAWMQAALARADKQRSEGHPFTGLFTGNAAADQAIRDEFVEESGDSNWYRGMQATYEANDNSFVLPANPADAEFKAAWQSAVNRVLLGQQEPPEAMAQAQTEAQQALDTAWAAWDGKS